MPYLPTTLPAVTPDLDDAEFWRLCNARRLCFQRCDACGKWRHPPTPLCASCRSDRVAWVEGKPPMRVFTYTIVHHSAHPATASILPYNVALIEFPSCGGVRLISNVIEAGPDDLAVGRAVELVWDEGPGGQTLPRFRIERA